MTDITEDPQPCVHCLTPIVWDEDVQDYRHMQSTHGCPMALEPLEISAENRNLSSAW